MIIDIPKETKIQEARVALTPGEGARKLAQLGHTVRVQELAGIGSGFFDGEYQNADAQILKASQIWAPEADLVVKVKEPTQRGPFGLFLNEYKHFRRGQVLFTYLHLAANKKLAKALCASGVTAIDYATVQLPDGSLPLLRPMSEISGRLAIQEGAELLKERGILIGGTSTVKPAEVLILGGGTVGTNAAETALGMDARVTILDINPKRVEWLRDYLQKFVNCRPLNRAGRYQQLSCEVQEKNAVLRLIRNADLLICAVLVPGAKTPRLVTEDLVKTMKKGAIVMDVSIDQGGCVETSRPTDHRHPTFVKHGVIHYCVANMPGIVPKTSTLALTGATLPYIIELASKGFERAVKENSALAKGVNTYKGHIVHQQVAETLGLPYTPLETLL